MEEKRLTGGGPAFPTDYHSECPECKTEVYGATSHGGMTLRDYFAAKALVALTGPMTFEQAAGYAYQQADAMLKARIIQ